MIKRIKEFDPKSIGLWQYIFIALSAIGLVLMVFLSRDAGISGDEFYHYDHSANVYNYYKTLGKDSTAHVITPNYNLPYYGQVVDNIAYFFIKTFNIDDFMGFRHAVNAVMGWLAILFAGLLVRRMSGSWKVGVITMALFLVSPRFIGHSFNNLKDLPLATATIMTIYFITRFLDELPKIRISTAIWLAISIGFAIGVRVGGLIVIGYFALFAIVYYIYRYKTLKKEFVRVFLWSLGIAILGYGLAVLSWPFAIQSPISNPLETLGNMTKFSITLRQIFHGSFIWSDLLPWYYTPKFILMTIPFIIILGFVIGLVMMFKNKEKWFYNFILLFTFIFPLFWIIINKSNVYGGWRHAIFVYPSLVAFAGMGINELIDSFDNKKIRIIIASALGVLLISPISHIIRNHPYEYVYFNKLSGGMDNAYGRYELDYYFHSLREASEWVIENAEPNPSGEKIKVACWHIPPIQYYFRKDTSRFDFSFIKYYYKNEADWDYAIVCNTGIAPEELRAGIFPPKNTVYEVKVDKKPIAVVLKRENKIDLQAHILKTEGDFDSAVSLYLKAIELDPYNEPARIELAEIYLRANMPDSTINITQFILDYNPNSESALYFMAYAYYLKNDSQNTLYYANRAIQSNPKIAGPYKIAANSLIGIMDLYGAEQYLLELIKYDIADKETQELLISIYRAFGMDERNAALKLYTIFADHYKKIGEKEAYREYREVIEYLERMI